MTKYKTSLSKVYDEITTGTAILVVMRWFVFAGVILRLLLTYKENSSIGNTIWVILIILLFLYCYVTTIIAWKYKDFSAKNEWGGFQIVFETVLFSLFYLLSDNPDSDLFLFYFLPILTAAQYFTFRKAITTFIVITVLIVTVMLTLGLRNDAYNNALEILLRTFLPKWTFFLFILFLESIRNSFLRRQSDELDAVHKTAIRIANKEALDLRLDAIMDASIELLGATGCKIYLKEPNQPYLRLVAIKGVDSELLKKDYLMPIDKGIAGRVFQKGEVVIENNYSRSIYKIPEIQELFNAVIEVPLTFADETIGVLAILDNSRTGSFSEDNVSLVRRLSQYAAVAIQDRLTAEKSQLRARVLDTLNIAAKSMNETLEFDKTLSSIAFHAWKLATAHNITPPLFACVGLLDKTEVHLQFFATYPTHHLARIRDKIGRINLDETPFGIVGKTIKARQSILVHNVREDEDYIDFETETHSQVAIPLMKGDKVFGVISIEHPEQYAFTDELKETLEVLAAHAGVAIENSILYRQAKTLREVAIDLHRKSISFGASSNVTEVGESILEELQQILPFTRSTFQIINGMDRRLVAKRNLDDNQIDNALFKPITEDKLIQEIVAKKEVCILTAPEQHPNWTREPTTSDIKSWIGIPLVYKENEVIGLITVDQIDPDIIYEEYSEILEVFALHATSVFQNAILQEQNTIRVRQLMTTQENLETVLEQYEKYENLALIGLMFGESIHFARSKLGMAKTKADSIAQGYYGSVSDELRANALKIVDYLNDYLSIVEESQRDVIKNPNPIPLDLHKMLDEILSSKRILRIDKTIKPELNYKSRNPIVYAPRQQLRQVILVVVQNALDAMRRYGGILGIETDEIKRGSIDFLRVSISDTGKGIPYDMQKKIFELRDMDKSRRVKKGTGMGLFWAKSFIQSYDGDISIKNTSEKGTTMDIIFPRDFKYTKDSSNIPS